MAKEEKSKVGLFEVPEEGSPAPEAGKAPEQEISTQAEPQEPQDLDGLGLLDYEKTLAEQSNEASSSPDQVQSNSEESQQATETPMDAKEDPARFEYWQSKADRAASELNKFQDLQQKMHVYEPIINAIQKDDEILNMLENKINGKQTVAPTGQVQQQAQVPENRPDKPDKPATYDPAESVNDPESQSWKYRESLETYRDSMDEYREHLEQQRIAAVHQESEQQRQNMVVNHNNNTLKYEYGWEESKIQKFNSDMQNPQSFNIHNLARYYNFMEGVDSKDIKIANTRAEEQNKQRQRAGKIPQTPAKAASQSNATLSDADKFNLALLQHSTIRR